MSKAGPTTDAGFTLAGVLILLVALSLAALAVQRPAATRWQRAAEAEQIFRGQEYQRAIAGYWHAGGEEPVLPGGVAALLRDPRDGQRHLRRKRAPVLGQDWQVITGADGGMRGVSVSAEVEAFRVAALPRGVTVEVLDGRSTWRFEFTPPATPDSR